MIVRHYITWVGEVKWNRGRRSVSDWDECERNYSMEDARSGLPKLRTRYSGGPRKRSQAIFRITSAIIPKPKRITRSHKK